MSRRAVCSHGRSDWLIIEFNEIKAKACVMRKRLRLPFRACRFSSGKWTSSSPVSWRVLCDLD